MWNFFSKLFTSDFMPHGGCYFWRPELVWLHASSDTAIALAYFLIPFSLVQLVKRRRDLEFNWMFLMFGAFILACGLTHVMAIWNIWHSAYRIEGVIKAITALTSIPTAVLMFRLVPLAVALPSPARLRGEIEERKKVEEAVRNLNAELEERVENRAALLKRSNDALQRFAFIAWHDLQEPIRTVRSMSQLLARSYKEKLDSTAQQYINFVVQGSGRMQKLVSDLLVYAQALNADAPPLELTSSRDAAEAAVQELQPLVQETGACIRFGDLPDLVANGVHLREIFQNFISNALKYRDPERPPKVFISCEARNDDYVFCVEDNGVGIEPEFHEQIFVAFRRLHGMEYPGSGIGLAICKNIIEEYGGRIWVESALGEGSKFCFSLPKNIERRANAVVERTLEQNRGRRGAVFQESTE